MTRPTARVLAMLELLQSGGQRTVGDLADRLGVDERTVRRYAEHLADLGVPVQAQRGRYGGYRLAPGYKLPPLMLTDDEALAVVLGLQAAERAGLATTDPAATASALGKVARVLPRPLKERLESLLTTAEFTAPVRAAAPADADTLLGLASAARDRRQVVIGYTSWDGRTSRRALDIYGLVFHSGRWYVSGHDHARDAVRTFRLDRIAALEPGEGTYVVPADFDATTQVVSGIAAVGWAHEVAVVLHTSLVEANERLPRSAGALREHPDGVLLETRAERLDGMARMLAGLGWDFDVLTPDALREEVRSLADRLRANAGRAARRTGPAAP
ncbi:YafY family transcriptional regulator [Nocardioides sp. zg-536]|uniref:YafY family transcriptional regulator n=1 Tax=Nocardioides faecalis TaxID=2803858 RepID=A0A938Y6G8_9ACTN|nr:YafY family protein [Nocardioides faecalis]MBM9460145.1 YafY family transcriptional regulator [Nocardioides faecalis]MBS4754244.1 YafY family transcriptional regulator [Nocardioides faecalis]QVI60060.1 YafY family transcriptional regulator [Nocardioides faecalis]